METSAFGAPSHTLSSAAWSDSTEDCEPGRIERHWRDMLDRHITQMARRCDPRLFVHASLASPTDFRARVRSGGIGTLRFCHLSMGPNEYVQRMAAHDPAMHMVVFQFLGTTSFATGRRSQLVRPGDVVLINDFSRLRVASEGTVEQIMLINALSDGDRRLLGPQGLIHRPARGDVGQLALRWIHDACRLGNWAGFGAADQLGTTLSALVGHALHERPVDTTAPARARLDRASIEAQIMQRLAEPELSLGTLAESFGCSVRSLHRAFSRGGTETLERCIWRLRLEACAARLRTESAQTIGSLTELAMSHGFGSVTHFSTVFRARFGLSPSAYRRELFY